MKCVACGSVDVDTETVGYVNAREDWDEYELSQCGSCGHRWKWIWREGVEPGTIPANPTRFVDYYGDGD
jgi:hypothetical protein